MAPAACSPEWCDLCGRRGPIDADASAVAGHLICTECLEDMLDASAHVARAEMGMVDGCGGRA